RVASTRAAIPVVRRRLRPAAVTHMGCKKRSLNDDQAHRAGYRSVRVLTPFFCASKILSGSRCLCFRQSGTDLPGEIRGLVRNLRAGIDLRAAPELGEWQAAV